MIAGRFFGRRQREILLALALGLAALLSYLVLVQVREQSQVDQYVEGRVSYQVEDFELDELDANGQLVYRIRGQYWEHDQWEQRANFRQVNMVAFDREQRLWQAEADRGHVNAEGTVVVLEDAVVLNYRHQGDAARLTTERMTLYPHSKRFETDREVLIERGNSRITGSAMRGNLADENFEIDDMQSRMATDASGDGEQ